MDELKNTIFKNKNKNFNNSFFINLKEKINSDDKDINKTISIKNNIYYSRIYYFDWLRIISCFSVILIHASCYFYYNFNINSYTFKISFYYNGISRYGVTNFFMISGALFLNRDISFRKIFNKYIKNIFIHLFIWSLIYYVFNEKFSNFKIKNMIIYIIDGQYHFWYLFAIMGLYTIFPFLKEISKNEKLLKKFILFSFIILFLIPNYIYIFFYYSPKTYDLLNILIEKLNINFFSLNNFYFVLGYFLNMQKLNNKLNRMFIYLLGLIGLIFSTSISFKFCIIKNTKLNFFDYKFFNILFTSISIFVFFKNNFNNLIINKKKNNIIKKISNFTFGIYLIHPLILGIIMNKLNIFSLSINTIYFIPLISLITFILSLIFSIIIKFIPIIGKYLI